MVFTKLLLKDTPAVQPHNHISHDNPKPPIASGKCVPMKFLEARKGNRKFNGKPTIKSTDHQSPTRKYSQTQNDEYTTPRIPKPISIQITNPNFQMEAPMKTQPNGQLWASAMPRQLCSYGVGQRECLSATAW